MFKLAPYLLGALVTLAVTDHAPLPAATVSRDNATAAGTERTATLIDRSRKGDRPATPRRSAAGGPDAVVERVGLRDTVIAYRDRDGNVLFNTDPLTNTTVVAEHAMLPEATVRESRRVFVTTVPIMAPGRAAHGSTPPVEAPSRPAARAAKLPIGCDPPFSPLASPPSLDFAGRCLS
jgi:hypothetical protein